LVDLTVEIAGITLQSPLMLAASPLTMSLENLEKAVKCNVGAVDTKVTVEVRPPEVKPLQCTYWDPELKSLHWITRGGGSLYIEDAENLIKAAKRRLSVPVFGNFMGRSDDPKEWIRVCIRLQEAGADAIVTFFGSLPRHEWTFKTIELSSKILEPLCESLDIPVIFKIAPMDALLIPVEVAEAMEKAGVGALQATDYLPGFPSLNVEKAPFHQFPGIDVQRNRQFVSGPILRPIVYRAVYELSKAVKIPIIATGGMWEAKYAIESILYGASAVAVASGPIVKGWRMLKDIVEGIRNYLERHSYTKIDDFKGLAQQYVGESEEILPQDSRRRTRT